MDSPAEVGELIAGKYRIDKVLGTGGMGVVVAATHVGLNEVRAIKMLRPKLATNASYTERFIQEAQAIARLKSEHIARVHDVGLHTAPGKPDVPYMVIEYVDGSDFATVLRQRGALPIQQSVDYLLQMTEALAEAHKHDIVHRDIKPANLFLSMRNDGSPCVKVIDFGIAKTATNITQVGVVLGSPRYMSPEQIRESRDVDTRADIWSLGIVLYELLTGETPFQGGGILEVCERIFEDDPVRPSKKRAEIPAGLEAVVLKCLDKDRQRRYANVGELAHALAPFASEEFRWVAPRVARVLGVAPPAQRPTAPVMAPPSSDEGHTTDIDSRPAVVLAAQGPQVGGHDTSTDLSPPTARPASAPASQALPTLVFPTTPMQPVNVRGATDVTHTALGVPIHPAPVASSPAAAPASRTRIVAIAAAVGIAAAGVATAIAWPSGTTKSASSVDMRTPEPVPTPLPSPTFTSITPNPPPTGPGLPLPPTGDPSMSPSGSAAPKPPTGSQKAFPAPTGTVKTPGGLTSSRGKI